MIRAALGARGGRLVRQLLTEGIVVAAAGGAVGVLVTLTTLQIIPAVVPPDFPRLDAIRVDWKVMLFAAAVSLLAGLIAGLLPALKSARLDVFAGLHECARSSSDPSTTTARSALVAVEAGLAVVLLIGALLVTRSFLRLVNVDPGYDATNVLTARIYLPSAAREQTQADAFARALLARLGAVSGVVAVGAGSMAPFGVSTMATPLTISMPGRPPVTARARVYVVTPGYAKALGLRLHGGRLLSDADMFLTTQSVLVNDQFVNTFLGDREPIGVKLGVILSRGVKAEIVGVVRNVLKDGLATAPVPEVFIVPAHRYAIRDEINLILRTTGEPLLLAPALRNIVHELRSDAAVENVTTLASQVSASVAGERLVAITVVGFALMGVLLAGIGLYGVVSYGVAARTHEIGIRSALGASSSQILSLVLRDGMTASGIGLIAGIAIAATIAKLLRGLLFGISPFDPLSFFLTPLMLGCVALIACTTAGRRATRIDPVQALRSD